jgi:hypothetical protein
MTQFFQEPKRKTDEEKAKDQERAKKRVVEKKRAAVQSSASMAEQIYHTGPLFFNNNFVI